MHLRILLGSLLLACAAGAAAAENAVLLKGADLREKPFNDARALGTLPARASVSILQRKGSWAQIQAGKLNGWVKLLTLATVSGKRGDSGLDAANRAFKTGSTSQETTTGIKGFSEGRIEAFKQAKPDRAEMKSLDALAVAAAKAEQFAAESRLRRRAVDELPAPHGDAQ